MTTKLYNFNNPSIQKRASAKARTSTRPKTYRTRSKMVSEVKKELIKEELLKQQFLQQVGSILPHVNDALIKSATDPRYGSSDRKTIYSILGLLKKDDKQPEVTIADLLSDLHNMSED